MATRSLTVHLPPAARADLHQYAGRTERTQSQAVVDALRLVARLHTLSEHVGIGIERDGSKFLFFRPNPDDFEDIHELVDPAETLAAIFSECGKPAYKAFQVCEHPDQLAAFVIGGHQQ